ncbi:MAG: GTPase ObgE [Chloroflexi bacterium]|nr:GTPase ObgE [Chloroflexota bacterium]
MFDEVTISVFAGDGGKGVVTFRREKFVPFGGPDGGDGGRGGSVYLKASRHINTLHLLARRRTYRAEKGGDGSSRNKHGSDGRDLILEVPLGTQFFWCNDTGEEQFMADLASDGETVEVARGGSGGRGNTRFASSINQVPQLAERGQPGEKKVLRLELRLIADVGIVGQPNAGKSSLLAASSAARPRVADYPFTTTEPVLGVVDTGWRSFVMAEIPGLIEDAHRGVGLGYEFLRHVERTRLLIHLLDGSRPDPVADLDQVNRELELFDPALRSKPQLLVVNKIDLPEVQTRLAQIDAELSLRVNRVYHVSAATGQGVAQLMAEVARSLGTLEATVKQEPAQVVVLRPALRDALVQVSQRDGAFEVSGSGLEALFAVGDWGQEQLRARIRRRLHRADIAGALRRAGVQPGDKVRVGETELEWD